MRGAGGYTALPARRVGRMIWTAAATLTLTLGIAGSQVVGQAAGGELAVAARRFYRQDLGTAVHGVCRVPFDLLEPIEPGADGAAVYRVTLAIRDSTGLELTQQSWSQRVPRAMLKVPGASAGEQFHFALAAGRYTIDVAAVDSASGRATRTTYAIDAFAARPPASDLVLSSAIRPAADSTRAATGELRLGGFLIVAQTEPVLTPTESRLFYYVELYPGRTVDVTVQARVLRAGGDRVIAAQPETIQAQDAGTASSGLELAGLPPGAYQLELELRFPDSTVTRRAPFHMAGFATEAAIARALEERAADVFDRFTEDQLDSLYRPLVYILEGPERGVYPGLSLQGKRNFLRQFWARRDPTPATSANEAQEDYYRLMALANLEFREGGAGDVPGWRTDRGRIFIRYGEPDEVLRRPQSPTRPYEVWKYTRDRPRKFVFLDETGFGHYQLIYTDERREPSLSNWQELLGTEAVTDVQRF